METIPNLLREHCAQLDSEALQLLALADSAQRDRLEQLERDNFQGAAFHGVREMRFRELATIRANLSSQLLEEADNLERDLFALHS